MATPAELVGRQAELERLRDSLDEARRGSGSLVLVAGEAGVGKTRLAESVAHAADALVLWGRSTQSAGAPYGPIVAALREYLRVTPDGFADCGPLKRHLALVMPELGEPAPASDGATLFEAVRSAFEQIADDRCALVVLDDLQWSDDATLDLLGALAEPLGRLRLLIVGAYRSDGLPRDHTLRRLRHELRRGGRLEELTLDPLDESETGELLAEILEGAPAGSVTRTIHDRTEGIPFYVEELARALLLTGSLTPGRHGLELSKAGEVPLPSSVRDAVLIGASELSDAARTAADVAAAAGEAFDLDLVAGLSSDAGLEEAMERGVIVEAGAGAGAFRHALTREALYADLPWLQRRALHRRLAGALEAAGAKGGEIAVQWLGAREPSKAREAFLRAAGESRAVHAHRDAARAGREALELWPEGEDDERRIEALQSYATSAELSGELAEAARAWREICALRGEEGRGEDYAEAQRRLAAVSDMRGDRTSALDARRAAAEAYSAAERPAEAAVERLAIANYLRVEARFSDAIEAAQAAGRDAGAAGRLDLELRARGLEGVALAKRGDFEAGHEVVRGGLALALEHDLTGVAADLYQRLSLVLYDSADYRRAQETLDTALELCRADGDKGTEVACVSCMVYVLRERGEWSEALELGKDLISSGTAVWVAEGLIGVIHCLQGKLASARRLASSSLAMATRLGHFNMFVDTTGGLARVAAAEGADEEAADRCRALLARWETSEDHHYAVKGLRWGAGFFARRDDPAGAHVCAEALTRIASESGHPDALAALAYAIAETALADGDADTAAAQLGQALELHSGLDLPYERAEIGLRAGVALAAAGEREEALERLRDSYLTARKLGAKPLAADAAREVEALGESVVRRLGRRAARDANGAGLTGRELEVMRLVAVGRTNREIAQQLFLSPRTVDMHVRNILRKLSCRTRVEAAHRASELGLLG
jgi:DNA-binding CsgD family transcriptional regulator/tetratricopeptide (TPR) repeat protein